MHITLRTLFLIVSLACIAACEKAPPAPPHKAVTDMKQFMSWVMDPAADALWASVGTVVTEKGEEHIAPKTDEEWATARNHAATVAEAANILMLDGRAKDREGWMLAARNLIDQAERAMKAAEAKNAEDLFTANSDVYLACSECHKTYAFGADARTSGSEEK